VKRLIFGFVSLDVVATDSHFRRAREAAEFEPAELDEGLLQLGLRAAAMRVPFLPTRVGLGSDILRYNPWLKTVRSPYEDATELVAMPALRLDAALLHVTEADAHGNCLILSPDPFFDDLMARAADRTFLSCDRLLPPGQICDREKARYSPFERSLVAGVSEIPFGAHPTASDPNYGIDVEHLAIYNAAGADGWARYRAQFIELADHQSYIDAAGGRQRLCTIPQHVF
jgi:glutaconate CoA-transferase subunit A